MWGDYRCRASRNMDTRSLAQAVQEVLAIIGRDHIIDDRLTIAIHANGTLALVTSEYDNRSNVGGHGHLLSILACRIPGRPQTQEARMRRRYLQLNRSFRQGGRTGRNKR